MKARWHRARRGLVLLGLTALLLLAWDVSGADLTVTRWYGGPGGFAWRDAWLTRTLFHDGGRLAAGVLLGVLAWDLARPIWAGPTRSERAFWLAVVVVSMLLVPAHKRMSLTSCPWELAEFGGQARYVSHWLRGVVDGGPGHCFPSGHAVAAFGFIGLYFLWRPHRPAAARAVLLAVCVAGVLFAWAQLARGAHYLSHSLWTGWLSAALAWTALWVAPRVPASPGAVLSAGAPPGGEAPMGQDQAATTRIE